MKNIWNDCVDYIRSSVARNAKTFTIITVLAIMFTGLTIMLSPNVWFFPPITYAVFVLILLLPYSVKSVFKAILAFVFTTVASSISYVVGSVMNPYDATPLLWFASYWLLLCVTLTYSYIVVKAASRWDAILTSLWVAGAVSHFASITFLSSTMGALFTFVSGFAIFVYMYHISKISSTRHMPVNLLPDNLIESIVSEVENNKKWDARIITTKNDTGYIYVFTQDKGFLLNPIWLDSPLSNTFSKRGKNLGLGYKGNSVNNWMLETAINKNPTWKANGAQLFPVFLSLYEGSVKSPSIISTTMPDVHHVYPVGIMDGSYLIEDNNRTKILPLLEKHFGAYARPLSAKQHRALLGLGTTTPIATEK